MKARIECLIKVFVAGCLAFLVLNLFTCLYRGGLPSIADETMSTPVRYVPNTYFSLMTEGISIGVYDKNGYNNAYPAEEVIDYLCLGSSQMEAKEVMPNQNLVYSLNEKLNSGGNAGYAYNIGISGEHLPACISRLEYAIKTYCPQKAVIIETGELDFPQEEIDEALEEVKVGSLLYSYSGGIMGLVRKLPYVRLAYIQLAAMRGLKSTETDDSIQINKSSEFDRASYTARITPLMEKATENAGGLPIIIFYHPGIAIHQDGSISTNGDSTIIHLFQEVCEENGIYFLDMSDRFQQEYEESYTLPYGFANTSVGSGHLNKYGHAMIADELYKLISEVA